MKVFNLLLAVSLFLTTMACTNDNLERMSDIPSEIETKSMTNENVELATVVELLLSVEVDQMIMDEVKQGVKRSIHYGLDEEYRFTDMIKCTTSKLYRLPVESKLIEKMKKQLNSSQIARGMEGDSLFNYLSENDIQIYWPYSQNWDGKTTPVITYLSDNDTNWSYGYKKIKEKNGLFRIDTLVVDKEYLKNNTVWIINKNNTPYDELPDFEQGEVINKDGVFFYSEIGKKQMREKQSKRIGMGGTSVYIGSLCFFAGDAIGGIRAVEFIWGHISGGLFGQPLSGVVNRTRITILKGEVDKEKQIDYNIQPQWFTQQGTNALVVIEKDGGSAKSLIRTIHFKGDSYGTPEAMVDVRIDYERNDDFIFDKILNRSSIFGPDNKTAEGKWRRYQDKDMWFTLPTK